MLRRQNYHAQKTENHAQEKSRGFISLSEAAKLCTYSQEYLSLLARRGELKAQKIGRNWFTKTDWLKKYIEDHPADLNGNIKGRLLEEEKLKKIIHKKRFKNLNVLGEVGATTRVMKKKMAGARTKVLLATMLMVLLVGVVLIKPNYVKDFATMEIKLAQIGTNEFKRIFWNENAAKFEAPEQETAKQTMEKIGGKKIVAGAKISEVWKNLISQFNQVKNLNLSIAKNFDKAEQEIYLAHYNWQKTGERIFSWLEKKNFAINLGDFKMFGKSGEIRDWGIVGAMKKILASANKIVGEAGGSATELASNIGDKIGEWLSSFQKTEWDSRLLIQLAKRKSETTQIVYEGDWINQIGQGEAGQAGASGKPGATGATGKIGSQGPRGEKGEKGETGPQGLQGLQGLQGIAGPAGASGGTSITNVYNVGVPGTTAHDGAGSSFAAKYIGAGELSVSGNTSLNGSLTVQGGTSFNSAVNIAGILNGGNAVFSGVTMNTLNATTTNIDFARIVDGRITTLNATTTNIDTLQVFGNATTTGVQSIVGQLKVATSTLDEYYKFGVGGPVYIAGSLYHEGNATTTGTGVFSNSLAVATTTHPYTLNIGGTGYFSDGLMIGGYATTSNLTVQGNATTTGSHYIGGDLTVARASAFLSGASFNSITTTDTAYFGGNLTVVGATDLQDNVFDSLGDFTIADNLMVSGNATTTGSHYIGGDLTVARASAFLSGASFNSITTTDTAYISGRSFLMGNVGIGTTAPTSTLAVYGNFNVQNASNGTSNLYVNSTSGNIGIGTTGPLQKLDVNGNLAFGGSRAFGLFGTILDFGRGSSYFTGFNLGVGASSGLFINSNGNVGIGMTNPVYKLEVNGTASTSALYVGTNATTTGVAYVGLALAVATTTSDDFSFQIGAKPSIFQHGVSILGYATTSNLTVQGNATTTGTQYFGGDINMAGAMNQAGGSAALATTTVVGSFTVQDADGNSRFLVNNLTGKVGIGTSGPDGSLEVLNADSAQLRLSQANEVFYADFQVDNTGDLLLNMSDNTGQGQLILANEDTIAIGGVAGQIYNAIANDATSMGHGLNTDTDLYIGGKLEVDDNVFFDGNVTIAGDQTVVGTTAYESNVDMQNNLILNVGHANTDFTTGGGLNLAGDLAVNSGNLTSSGNLTLNPTGTLNLGGANTTVISTPNTVATYNVNGTGLTAVNIAVANVNPAILNFGTSAAGNDINIGGSTATVDLENGTVYVIGGNIGINTTAPTSTLQTIGNFSIATTSALGFNKREVFSVNSTNHFATTTVKDYFQVVQANEATSLFVDKGGNVGIGTTAPNNILDVNGTANIPIIRPGSVTSYVGGVINLSTLSLSDTAAAEASLNWRTGTWTTYRQNMTITPYGAYDEGGAGKISFIGNVGIATTNPTAFLEISTTTNDWVGADRARPLMRVATKTTEAFYIAASGNVGVGTTNPLGLLQVGDNNATLGNKYALFSNNVGGNNPSSVVGLAIGWNKSNGQGESNIIFNTTGGGTAPGLAIGDFNGATYKEDMRIDQNGNVGIATTNPTAFLEISTTTNDWIGADRARPLMRVATKTTEAFYIAASGAVGIGTTDPSWTGFDVNKSGFYFHNGATAFIYNNGVNTGFNSGTTPGSKVSIAGNLSVGSTFYSVAAPTNGAIIEGNVGVGTTAPSALLHASSTTEQLRLSNGNVASTNFTSFKVLSAGDLIIDPQGTATSTVIGSNLQVEGNASTTGALYVGGHFNVVGIAAFTGGASFNSITTTDTAYIGGKSYFGGNVGIGATAPLAKLDVRGDVYIGAGAEIYTNGGYESGGVTTVSTLQNNMYVWQGGTGNVTPSVETTIVHTGTNSQKIVVTDDGTSLSDVRAATASSNYNAVVGDVFTYSFWVYSSVAITNAQVAFASIGQSGWGTAVSFSVPTINTWTKISGMVTCNATVANNGTNIQAKIGDTLSGGTGTVYFDDFSIYRTGLALVNANAAVAGGQQNSPVVRWSGYGWKTDATAGSQAVDFRSYVVPVQGAAAPTGYLTFESAINGATYGNTMNFTSGGNLGIGTTAPTSTLAVYGNFNVQNASNGTSNLYVNPTSGNVGIGTTGPTQKLDVNGNMRVGSGIIYGPATTEYLSFDSTNGSYLVSNGTYVRAAPASDLVFVNNNNESMRIKLGGNVGIGTNAPTALFEIATTTNDWPAGVRPLMRVATKTIEALYVSAAGNVGIGTATPEQKLDVAGSTRLSSYLQLRDFDAGSWDGVTLGSTIISRDYATVFWNGGVIVGGYANDATPAAYSAGGAFLSQGPTALAVNSGNVGIGITNPVGQFQVSTTTMFASASGTEPRVGIGTSAPSVPLHVSKTGLAADGNNWVGYFLTPNVVTDAHTVNLLLGKTTATGASAALSYKYDTTSGDEGFGIALYGDALGSGFFQRKGGNVGIGTLTPGAELVVVSDTYGAPKFMVSSSTTVTTPSLYVANTGNVGIGNTNPTQKLEVTGNLMIPNGNAYYSKDSSGNAIPLIQLNGSNNLRMLAGYNTQIEIYNTAQTYALMAIKNNGNVGIGTTNPTALFEVSTTTAHSTISNRPMMRVATGTTEAFFVDRFGNVGIGQINPQYKLDVAGNLNLNATSTIYMNSLPAFNASSTSLSVSAGTQAGNALLDSGIRNVFVGYQAGYSATTSDYNVGVGYLALKNTNRSGGGDQGGDRNVAVGDTSMDANTYGGYNTAVGFDSLGALISGNQNTVVGNSALYQNTTGSLNVAMGYVAGYLNKGTGNVFLGTGSGTTEQFDTSNYSVAIGYYAKTFGSNQLSIDNASTTAPLIFGDFSTRRVGLGTTAPVAMFEISTTTDWVAGVMPLMRVATKTTEAFYIAATGNVGVGTTAPDAKLSILNGSGYLLSSKDTAGTTRFAINALHSNPYYYDIASTNYDLRISSYLTGGTGGNIQFQTNSVAGAVERMRINPYGNVGIATTNPTAFLEISTTTTDWVAGVRPLMRVATKTTEALYVSTAGNLGIGSTNPSFKTEIIHNSSGTSFAGAVADFGLGLININGAANTWSNISFAQAGSGSVKASIGTQFPTNNADVVIGTWNSGAGLTEKMRITGLGNVGIGTTAPTSTLQTIGNFSIATTSALGFTKREVFSVNGTNSFATTSVKDYFKVVQDNEATSFGVEKSGYVGINTTNYGVGYQRLEVNGGAALRAGGYLYLQTSDAQSSFGIVNLGSGGSDKAIFTGNNLTMGVGQIAPTAMIHASTTDEATVGMRINLSGTAPTANAFDIQSQAGAILTAFTASGGLIMNVASSTVLNVQDGSGNKVFVVDSDASPAILIYEDAGVKNISISHDGTNAVIVASSGEIQIGTAGNDVYVGTAGTASNLVFEESSSILGQGGNTITLGQSGDHFNLAVTGVNYWFKNIVSTSTNLYLYASSTSESVIVMENPADNKNLRVFIEGAITTGSSTDVTDPTVYNYNNFGSGTPGQAGIATTGDVYIRDTLEVDGTAYLAGGTAWTQGDLAENIFVRALTTEEVKSEERIEKSEQATTTSTSEERTEKSEQATTTATEEWANLPEAGDVVLIDPVEEWSAVKSFEENSNKILGVVSTDPAGVMRDGLINSGKEVRPITMSGTMPVKVNLQNGPIKKGDLLTTAARPGFAMKAIDKNAGIVGIALQDYLADFVEGQEMPVELSMKEKAAMAMGNKILVLLTVRNNAVDAVQLAKENEVKVAVKESLARLPEVEVAGYEFMGGVAVKDLVVSGKVLVMGASEFLGAAQFKDNISVQKNLELGGAIVKNFSVATGTSLSLGDAVYVATTGAVERAYADNPAFRPAIGFVVGFENQNVADTEAIASSTREILNEAAKVKVAIGGTVGGFKSLVPGARYYLAELSYYYEQREELATTTDLIAPAAFSLNAPLVDGSAIQPMALAISESEILVMPSLQYTFVGGAEAGSDFANSLNDQNILEMINNQPATSNQQPTNNEQPTNDQQPTNNEQPIATDSTQATTTDTTEPTPTIEPTTTSEANSEEQIVPTETTETAGATEEIVPVVAEAPAAEVVVVETAPAVEAAPTPAE
ncbi:MAG: hypothetical protein PHT40_02310 [Patescibacteria group bacterium]|nr:hypothetical protein [Patescibacteria group bacterium]